MADFPVVPARTALVNVDLQNFFVENAPGGLTIVGRVNRLAAECRKAGILVIHTSHVLRPDGSNIGVLGDLVPAAREQGFLNAGTRTAALHEDLAVEPGDILLDKPRFGAFHGTDLELILRQRGIDTIIISGIDTAVCCDTTAREANARDFRVLFLRDGTASTGDDPGEAARCERAALEIIGAVFGQVLTIDEVLRKLLALTDEPEGPLVPPERRLG
jgi:ureidoacrylate peracid hydrolase